ncbi:MAG: Vitamin B12-dependent ribonucleotide reductase, partial [Bdellovibrionaceae bacterium]|nr:Vitamin B12-dependent ribonucleotide reductase [Pseudobdellovibrionaceae bacterium]
TKLWEEALSRGRQFGFRNAQTTAIAPTGTIAFMMDCDTTGIEPEYALIKQKQLAGGGVLTTVNGTVGQGLRALGRSEEESRELVDVLKAEGETAFQQRLSVREAKVFLCAAQLRADAHLEMMAAVQPFISGAISKTVNLHADASVEDVASVFERGAALGLKSVAVYRDGSKQAQPLKRVGDNELSASFQISPDEVSTCPICSYPTVICGTCWVCPQCGHSLACS